MKLVSDPTLLMPFTVALAPDATTAGQIRQILGQGAPGLQVQPFRSCRRTFLAFGGTSAFGGSFGRSRRLAQRLFAAFNRGGIPTDMTHQALALLLGDHG